MISAIDVRRRALAKKLSPSIQQKVSQAIQDAAASGLLTTIVDIGVVKNYRSAYSAALVLEWLDAWGYNTNLRGPVNPAVTKESIDAAPDELVEMRLLISWGDAP